jgi:GAF domain-containing protein
VTLDALDPELDGGRMPMSVDEVHRVLRTLDDLRYSAGDLDAALRRIVEATHKVFAVDGAGLMLIDPEQLLRNVAVSDERVDEVEKLQIEHGEGPCVDAFEEKVMTDSDDLTREKRWPLFSPAAAGRGLRAVMASPIPYNQYAVGVVVVFSCEVRPWSLEGKLALIAFTDLAALTIANTMQSQERGERAEQLQHALDARVVIEQAKGVLVARDGLGEREAFERLRRQARDQRRRVADVAAEVVRAAAGRSPTGGAAF